MKKTIERFARLLVASSLSTVLAGAIAEYYRVLAPNFLICLCALLLLEIAGGMLRGKVPYMFTDEEK